MISGVLVDANNGRKVKESHRGLEELASGYNLGVGPFHRKILQIAGHEVVGVCGLGALQENVVIGIRAGMHPFGRLDPKSILSDSA